MPTITLSSDPHGSVSAHLNPSYDDPPCDTLAPGAFRGCAWGDDPDFPECVPEIRWQPPRYPDADYACLECAVVPDCDPSSELCEWKQLHHRAMGPNTYEIVHAVEILQQRGSKVGGSAIARLLNRTRSGIHGRIKRVRNAGLIGRKGRRIYLTDAGRAFLEGYKRR